MKEKTFERKNELLTVALNEFTTKSYDDASLNTIIKNAGISKGTFYYHFKDKEMLYLYLLEAAVQQKWAFMNQRMQEMADTFAGKDIFEKFLLQAQLGVEFTEAYPHYYKLGRMFIKEQGNPVYETGKHMLGSSTEATLEGLIAEGVAAGDFRSEFPQDFIVKVLSYMFLHFDEIFVSEADSELDMLLENLTKYVEFLKHGLGSTQV